MRKAKFLKHHAQKDTERKVPEKSFHPVSRKGLSGARAIWQGFRFLVSGREKDFVVNRVEAEIAARETFAALLRAPFPESSDAEISRHWANVLQRSPRQVLNWLRLDSSASFTDAYVVASTHGVWETARIAVGELRREDVLARIGQRRG